MPIILKCRQHPGHLFCEKTLEDIPIEGAKGIDEDDPVNSDYNMKLTRFSFQVDRYRNPFWIYLLLSFLSEIDTYLKKVHFIFCSVYYLISTFHL